MKTIGHILARYTGWVLRVLAPLGIWGVFAIAFADSALLGMPVDAIVAYYVYQNHRLLLFYVLMASLGSVMGSIPLYIIGYLGGEKVLRKRISEERFLRIHRSFEEHEFWALMFPAMLPPPMPYPKRRWWLPVVVVALVLAVVAGLVTAIVLAARDDNASAHNGFTDASAKAAIQEYLDALSKGDDETVARHTLCGLFDSVKEHRSDLALAALDPRIRLSGGVTR